MNHTICFAYCNPLIIIIKVNLADVLIPVSTSVQCELSMSDHVSNVVSSCFYQLRQLRSVRRCLPFEARRSLVTAFIANRLDYCNAILYNVAAGTIQRLQVVLNATARLIIDLIKYDHLTPFIHDEFHWLPVLQRVKFKIAVLAFNCICSTRPAYFNKVYTPLSSVSDYASTPAAVRGDLIVPASKMIVVEVSISLH